MNQPPIDGARQDGMALPLAESSAGGGGDADVDRGLRAAVLGLGQIGGSLALAGRAAGVFAEVAGFGRSEDSLRRATELGLCDWTTTSAADAVAGADIVVLATPLRSIPALVDAIAAALSPGALVIDVGSVKGTAVRDIEDRLPRVVSFVACHPLAGTERSGPEAANAELFRGRRCIICPTPRTGASALNRARALWRATGADVMTMPAELHDRVMAGVSHLPHVAAYALAGALGTLPPDVRLAARGLPTTSLRDTVRIAASSPIMWADIFVENRGALLPLIDDMATRLGEIKDAVAAGDVGRVVALLEAARTYRAMILPS